MGKKLKNSEQDVFFQDLMGNTVVALRCHGAHWDYSCLMHRIMGDLSIETARKSMGGKALQIPLLFLLHSVLIRVLLVFFVVLMEELVEMLLETT